MYSKNKPKRRNDTAHLLGVAVTKHNYYMTILPQEHSADTKQAGISLWDKKLLLRQETVIKIFNMSEFPCEDQCLVVGLNTVNITPVSEIFTELSKMKEGGGERKMRVVVVVVVVVVVLVVEQNSSITSPLIQQICAQFLAGIMCIQKALMIHMREMKKWEL